MRIIVTAGPTREYLDEVRFLTNASSGRMGYAVAHAAARAGHAVHLVSGPVALRPPSGVKTIFVTTTREMYKATARLFPKADCLIAAAAPADYAPARRRRGKGKKMSDGLTLRLKPTVDILAALGRRKGKRVVIGFALEVQKALANALAKLKRKNADAIVLNTPAALGAVKSDVTVITSNGERMQLRNATKGRIARRLISLAEALKECKQKGEKEA